MEGFDSAAYKRIYHGLLASMLTSLMFLLLLAERVVWHMATPEADRSLMALIMAALEEGPEQLRGLVQLTNTVRTALRLLSAIPLITGLGDVIAASRHYRVARNLFLIRFVLDAVFAFVEVLLLSLETRGLMEGTAEQTGSLLRELILALDMLSFIIIGFLASMRLLRGFDETLRAVGSEGRLRYLRRIWRAVLWTCVLMTAALLAYAVLWMAGVRQPALPAFFAVGTVGVCFLARFILRLLILREARLTMNVIRELSQ